MQPKELGVDKLSVGAATWDGAFVMVAYLGTRLSPNLRVVQHSASDAAWQRAVPAFVFHICSPL